MKDTLAMRIAALVLVTLTVFTIAVLAYAQPAPGPIIRQGPILTTPRPTITLPPNIVALRPQGPTIEFQAKLDPDLLNRAATLNVYRLMGPRFGRESFGDLRQRLFGGELGGQMMTAGGVLTQSDDRGSLLLDPETGLMSFSWGMSDQIDDRPGELPGPNRAAAIAREFLDSNGLGPGDTKQRMLAHVGRIRSAAFDPRTGQEGQAMDQMLVVYFGRVVDDIQVVGDASKMVVQIGDGGKVVGAGFNWRELGPATRLSMKDLRSADQIMGDVQNFLRRELPTSQSAVVTQIGLFYYDNSGQYLQPVIGFSAMVKSGEFEYSYFGQTPVLNTPPELVGPAQVSAEATRMLMKSSQELQAPTEGGD